MNWIYDEVFDGTYGSPPASEADSFSFVVFEIAPTSDDDDSTTTFSS